MWRGAMTKSLKSIWSLKILKSIAARKSCSDKHFEVSLFHLLYCLPYGTERPCPCLVIFAKDLAVDYCRSQNANLFSGYLMIFAFAQLCSWNDGQSVKVESKWVRFFAKAMHFVVFARLFGSCFSRQSTWCLALWEIAHSLFVLAGLYSTYVWSTPKSTESWRTLWTYVKMLWACCELADWTSLQSLDFPMRARHHDPEMRVLQMSSPLWMWLGRKVPWRKKEKTLKELKDKEQEKDKAQINTNETWENTGKRQAHIFLHGKAYDAYLPHRNKT